MSDFNREFALFVLDIHQKFYDANKKNKFIREYYKMTNLKLQKTMYFIYGYLQNKYDNLFDEKPIFNKWSYGPVCENVYYDIRRINFLTKKDDPNEIDLKEYEKKANEKINGIKYKKFVTSVKLDGADKLFFDKLIKVDPFKLVRVSHETSPWKETMENSEISDDKIMEYFKKFDFSVFDSPAD